jgi:hypothetical protein
MADFYSAPVAGFGSAVDREGIGRGQHSSIIRGDRHPLVFVRAVENVRQVDDVVSFSRLLKSGWRLAGFRDSLLPG